MVEGDHPVRSIGSVMGTEELVRIVEKADADDLVIVYVTGGTEGQWSTSTPWRVTEV